MSMPGTASMLARACEEYRAAGGDIKNIEKLIAVVIQDSFRAGFEHAVAGGEEASKKVGVRPEHLPLVMYFETEEDRRGMIDAVLLANPGMVTLKIPERKR